MYGFFEKLGQFYKQSPEFVINILLGVFSALSRMGFDDRKCSDGMRQWLSILLQQSVVAFFVIVVAAGICTYYHIDGTVATSIFLVSGFFAREILEQGNVMVKKIPEYLLRFKK